MPRRRRVRLENRLLALEAAVQTRPTAPPSVPVTDEQAAEVLAILGSSIDEQELGLWLAKRMGTAPAWLAASDTGEPETPDEPPDGDPAV